MASRVLRRGLLAVVLLVGAVQSRAQIQAIPPFVGNASDPIEFTPWTPTLCVPPPRIFQNRASLCDPSGIGCGIANSGGCGTASCVVHPRTGSFFFFSMNGAWEATFDTAALRFGGWFAGCVNPQLTTFQFYDVNDNLVATEFATAATFCNWAWFGWNFSGGPPIKRVHAESSNHFFYLDDLEADLAPSAPTVYCTPGTTTHGCSAVITGTANPKVANSTPCHISIAGVEGHKVGVLYYGLTKQLIPWCTSGLGVSTLCIKPPILATGPQNSAGTNGQCNGALSLDWSAFQNSHPGALGTPWAAGEKVFVQAWFRDPPACRSTNLSNALELTYQP